MDNLIQPDLGLAFKTLISNNGEYISPSGLGRFVWPAEGNVEAQCSTPHSNVDGFSVCSCGIYGAYRPSYALAYRHVQEINGGLFLLQPYPPFITYGNEALRASRARLVAVVEYGLYGGTLSTVKAARYFNLPILDQETAILMFEFQMLKVAHQEGLDWWKPINWPKETVLSRFKEYLKSISMDVKYLMEES